MEWKKEERRRRKTKKNKIKIFAFDFLNCEEKSWDSGTIFDIRIAKGFHLYIRVLHLIFELLPYFKYRTPF